MLPAYLAPRALPFEPPFQCASDQTHDLWRSWRLKWYQAQGEQHHQQIWALGALKRVLFYCIQLEMLPTQFSSSDGGSVWDDAFGRLIASFKWVVSPIQISGGKIQSSHIFALWSTCHWLWVDVTIYSLPLLVMASRSRDKTRVWHLYLPLITWILQL